MLPSNDLSQTKVRWVNADLGTRDPSECVVQGFGRLRVACQSPLRPLALKPTELIIRNYLADFDTKILRAVGFERVKIGTVRVKEGTFDIWVRSPGPRK